jgi:hypothetical protein
VPIKAGTFNATRETLRLGLPHVTTRSQEVCIDDNSPKDVKTMESSDYEVNCVEVASCWANAVAEFGSILNSFNA